MDLPENQISNEAAKSEDEDENDEEEELPEEPSSKMPSLKANSKGIKKEADPNKKPAKQSKKATESIKKIMRLFRKYIKDSDLYNIKQVEEYFTHLRFSFSQETYNQNLGIFEELTCCKKGDRTIQDN